MSLYLLNYYYVLFYLYVSNGSFIQVLNHFMCKHT